MYGKCGAQGGGSPSRFDFLTRRMGFIVKKWKLCCPTLYYLFFIIKLHIEKWNSISCLFVSKPFTFLAVTI